MSARFFTNQADQTLLRKFQGVFESNTDIEWFDALIGLPPEKSTSRNPMEQPRALTPDEFTRRAPRPDQKHLTTTRDETAALTAQIEKVEREIDARVTALYGL